MLVRLRRSALKDTDRESEPRIKLVRLRRWGTRFRDNDSGASLRARLERSAELHLEYLVVIEIDVTVKVKIAHRHAPTVKT